MRLATDDELDELLRKSFDDHRLSRAERKVLRELVESGIDAARLRRRAFYVAETLFDEGGRALVAWLEDVSKAVAGAAVKAVPKAEAHFSPGKDCRARIARAIGECRERADICVFTITDNQLTEALIAAHKRGVALRIAADNDKAHDRGSDVERLADAGVPVRVDLSPHHMHHKFALFDGETLLNGSYNWTRSAFEYNRENVVVIRDASIASRFARAFDEMWNAFEAP